MLTIGLKNFFFFFLISPLEQFEFISFVINNNFYWDSFFPLNFPLNYLNILISICILICLVLLSTYLFSQYKCFYLTEILKPLFNITRDLCVSNLPSIRKENKINLIFLLLTIFFCNLLGMLPFFFTITSIFCFTLFFALYHFLYNNLFTIKKQKWTSFVTLLPTKTIYWIAPILILIESVSYNAKLLSLSLRLFANMVAGHLMLKIIAIFFEKIGKIVCVNFLATNFLIYNVLILLILLETVLAFLQAYVFTLLTSLYLKEINS